MHQALNKLQRKPRQSEQLHNATLSTKRKSPSRVEVRIEWQVTYNNHSGDRSLHPVRNIFLNCLCAFLSFSPLQVHHVLFVAGRYCMSQSETKGSHVDTNKAALLSDHLGSKNLLQNHNQSFGVCVYSESLN